MAKVATKTQATEHSGPGLIVLQWLTYVFWGWTVVALLWLAYIVLATFMTDNSYGNGALYAMAAALVLLPLSVVCDVLYVRREPLKKAGASMVVMVIHAVIFAVLGIGSLIAAVFSVIQLYVGSGSDSTSTQVWLYSFLIAAAVYALLFVRALNPLRSLRLAKLFPAVMAAVVGVFVVLGFAGPLAVQRDTRDDRRIEAHLDGVRVALQDYVDDHEALPNSLADLTIRSEDARALVSDGLVRYAKDRSVTDEAGDTELRYQLCVTYVRAHDEGYGSYLSGSYEEYIGAYSHPKGEVCYKLKATAGAVSVQDVKMM